MIYYSIPYNSEKNLGQYYNGFMQLLPDNNDFACFMDGDAMFLHPFFGSQLEKIIALHPECGLFTCTTNRVGAKWQLANNWEDNNIKNHRAYATAVYNSKGYECEDVTNKPDAMLMSGVMILIRKSTWLNLGGFEEKGMLGIDTDIHRKAKAKGEKLYLMKGVYIYHWYRGGHAANKTHLL
ncbi:MAG TPA: hypothetical protein VG603_15220 [Chitinophagales bacterium]|nr:hypothetical protein [Chitinophagales bacterium]